MNTPITKEEVKELTIGQKVVIVAKEFPAECRYSVGDIVVVTDKSAEGIWLSARQEGRGYKGKFVLYPHEVALAPAPLKFKVGDRVVVGPNPKWSREGEEGTVRRVDGTVEVTDYPYPYLVGFDNGVSYWMREQDLSLVEVEPLADWERELLAREIPFEDIQEGDKLRAEYADSGVKYTLEGEAHEQGDNGNWETTGGNYIAAKLWNATYTLLERPKPVKPNPYAEAPVGTLARNPVSRALWIKTEADLWRSIPTSKIRVGTISPSSGIDNKYPLRENWEIIHTP